MPILKRKECPYQAFQYLRIVSWLRPLSYAIWCCANKRRRRMSISAIVSGFAFGDVLFLGSCCGGNHRHVHAAIDAAYRPGCAYRSTRLPAGETMQLYSL